MNFEHCSCASLDAFQHSGKTRDLCISKQRTTALNASITEQAQMLERKAPRCKVHLGEACGKACFTYEYCAHISTGSHQLSPSPIDMPI